MFRWTNYSSRAKTVPQHSGLFVLCSMLIVLSCSPCLAQTIVIEGSVTFSGGAVPEMANITLRSADGNVAKLIRVDSNGHYVVEDIPPGTYFMIFWGANVSEDRAGTFFRDDVVIQSDTPLPVTVNVVLQEPL